MLRRLGYGLAKSLQARNRPELAFTLVAPDIVAPILGVRGVGYLVKEVGNLPQQVSSAHVLTPTHLTAVVQHVARCDPMENTNERPTQPGEIALSLVLVNTGIAGEFS